MSRRSPMALRARQGQGAAKARGMVRRFRVAVGRGVAWLLEGYIDFAGNTEQDEAEVFTAPMLYRPKKGNRAEVIAVTVGGESGHRVVVATRDHDLEKALVEAIAGLGDDDESIMANSTVMVRCTKSGQVHATTHGGSPVRLATYDDVKTIRDELDGHVHTYVPGTGTPTTTTINPSVTDPAGTTDFRAS